MQSNAKYLDYLKYIHCVSHKNKSYHSRVLMPKSCHCLKFQLIGPSNPQVYLEPATLPPNNSATLAPNFYKCLILGKHSEKSEIVAIRGIFLIFFLFHSKLYSISLSQSVLVSQSVSVSESIILSISVSQYQSIIQSVKQSVNQSASQPVGQLVTQSVTKSVSQSVTQSLSRSVNQSARPPGRHTNRQTAIQPDSKTE